MKWKVRPALKWQIFDMNTAITEALYDEYAEGTQVAKG